MHISEGVLSLPVLAGGIALGGLGLAAGIKKIDNDQVVTTGIMSAFFFAASLIHVPVGVSNAHLLLTGLTGIILGWASFPAIFTALALQVFFFHYGGITTLGVNLCNMGYAAVCSRYIFVWLAQRADIKWSGFISGFSGIAISSLLAALSLALSNEGFLGLAVSLFIAHLPVMIAEGLITMFTAGFLWRMRPDILHICKVTQKTVQ